ILIIILWIIVFTKGSAAIIIITKVIIIAFFLTIFNLLYLCLDFLVIEVKDILPNPFTNEILACERFGFGQKANPFPKNLGVAQFLEKVVFLEVISKFRLDFGPIFWFDNPLEDKLSFQHFIEQVGEP